MKYATPKLMLTGSSYLGPMVGEKSTHKIEYCAEMETESLKKYMKSRTER